MDIQNLTEALENKLTLNERKEVDPELQVLSAANENVDLRSRFEEFRKRKMEKLRYSQGLKQAQPTDRKDPTFKRALREKFIQTARKYIGIPYGKRYLKPEDPLYNSPLFLDCCALIRQIVYDLREEFGFVLPGYNQNFQYDALPVDVTFETLVPGDLIFYEAEFYNPKVRKLAWPYSKQLLGVPKASS
eukprot:TRINITY_DN1801_c0_g1_i15.p1 TRINITY_DN1801_c0_g1~~TRINITY_DN1801_c0_g1_i15.p1  ORF type:complete len:189 (+),score=42.61 TRINITY_DN1801_c0_g1_i15:121-687(+)